MTTNIKCPHCSKDIGLAINYTISPEQNTQVQAQTPTVKTDDKGNVPFVDTSQAKQMRSKINIEGTISGKGEIRSINKKDGGTTAVCDAKLTDGSGEIKVTFWGEECEKVNDGTKIRITNGYTNSFKGEVSLTKGKFGRMEILA